MNFEEGVCDLVPRPPRSVEKPRRYKSKYPPNIYPTASTFNNRTTSRLIGNLSGNFTIRAKPHYHASGHATMGTSKGFNLDRPPRIPDDFESKMQLAIKKLNPREKVPLHKDRPFKKLDPRKNFIKLNADKNALKRGNSLPLTEPLKYLQKKDYGKVPQYLDRIKGNIENNFNMLKEIKMKEDERLKKEKYSLKNEDVLQIKSGLKQRWELLHNEYQKFAHLKKMDTQVMKKKKLGLEQEMKQIEDDLKKLSNKRLVVIDAKI